MDRLPWRALCWTSEAWRLWPGRSPCPLFKLPGASCHSVGLDYMHITHLGTDEYQFASVLELLVGFLLPQDAASNLDQLWREIQQACRRLHVPPQCRYKFLNKLNMFRRVSGYPKLRGKATEIRHFGHVLREVFASHHNPALRIHRDILLTLTLNNRMEDIISEYRTSFSLPAEAAERFKKQLQRHVAPSSEDRPALC